MVLTSNGEYPTILFMVACVCVNKSNSAWWHRFWLQQKWCHHALMIKENTQSSELSLTLANYTALLLLPHIVLWGLLSLVSRPPSFLFFGLRSAWGRPGNEARVSFWLPKSRLTLGFAWCSHYGLVYHACHQWAGSHDGWSLLLCLVVSLMSQSKKSPHNSGMEGTRCS